VRKSGREDGMMNDEKEKRSIQIFPGCLANNAFL
jgi:hypothetical protein